MMNAETYDSAVSLHEAASQLGLDSFSLYMLIQSDQAHPRRERWGELTIPQTEMDRLLGKTAASPAKEEVRQLC
jgi:hypothetical protein